MKVALKLAYLGDKYYGFQHQPNLITVESELRKALHRIGVINGDFCYAGRTDRGVSALGQVIDFWIDDDKAHLAIPRCINGRLPRDIWAWAYAIVPVGFSARWNALWREYRYILWNNGLDLDRMREAAEFLKGEHDFRNFSSCKNDTIRNILKLEISTNNGLIVFDIRADGFLWSMVRKIVCALELVGSVDRDPNWIHDLLDPTLNKGSPTALAEGLILMDVGYDALEWIMDDYSRKRAINNLDAIVKRRMSSANVAESLRMAMKK
ncbi:MAG: tRNA pseudouridine(38-40) synthase TruA [Methanotrichaceae archaeon]|nr:tRNA pseudouridine(38-40) synthase TruA [Methanotrichaceae archaeon]